MGILKKEEIVACTTENKLSFYYLVTDKSRLLTAQGRISLPDIPKDSLAFKWSVAKDKSKLIATCSEPQATLKVVMKAFEEMLR